MTFPRRPFGASRRAFTLIEVLTVIAVIAILASLILATSGYIQERGGRARAEAEIQAIQAALASYKIDNGDFPIENTGGPNSTQKLLQALHPRQGDGKVYLEQIRAFEYKTYNQNNRLLDPFGNPYAYFYDPDTPTNPKTGSQNNGPVEPDIWSWGKDGERRNASKPDKWIKNW